MEKCDINGYTIPAGTHVIVNVWALGRDPMSWDKADDFMPERFIHGTETSVVDFKGRDFKFLPFGAGRRICPGMNFGVATVEIMLANLVYCFDWELPDGLTKDDIDMTELFGPARKLVTSHLFTVEQEVSLVIYGHDTGRGCQGKVHTSSLVLEFVMAELMRNPQHMAKLQGEVRKHTQEGQETVEEENLSDMAYLRAVVKETLRLHPPTPLLLPHLSMADCVVDGYFVSPGTRVIINAAAIDFKGNDFTFLPFSAGRRICPGINFALATVEIMLTNLVYCFDWQLPDGMEAKDVDTTEVFGLTVHPKEKLMLYPKQRGATAAGGHSVQADAADSVMHN
nr:unnamed protein product [Digitaria exilis]